MPKKIEKPQPPEPAEELVVDGQEESREEPPRSLLDASPEPTVGPEPSDVSGSTESLADMALLSVKYGHSIIAKRTGYAEFRLDDEETEYWRKALRFMLRNVSPDKWPDVFAFILVIMVTGGKVIGLLDYRKASGNPITFGRKNHSREEREEYENSRADTNESDPTGFVDHMGEIPEGALGDLMRGGR